ncbi:MAG: ABC transporter ATP-binding protein [Candidatus Poseidoniaceae archaeon]|jgi:ATP-binding cassette subfamily B protein|nr:ABC transporter ATP-binding protein [Candidatus Poseidoniaceae archaeon]
MAKQRPLSRLISHTQNHRSTIWLASICSVVNKIFDLAPPILIGAAVDTVVEKDSSILAQLGIVDVHLQLWALVIASAIVWSLESLFQYFHGVLWRNLAQSIQHDLRIDTYSHMQSLEMAWFDEQRKGNLMAIMNDDINQLERFLDHGANDLLQVATTVVVIGSLFFLISWQVALFAILPIPIILWSSFRFQARIQPRYAEVRSEVGKLNAILDNNLEGITTIKSFTGEERESDRLNQASENYRSANRRAIKMSAAFVPLIRMAILMGFCATLLYGGYLTIDGKLGVGEYSVLVFMTQRLLWPLTRLGETFDLYQRAMASTTRVLDLLEVEPEIIDGETELLSVKGEIEFSEVCFAYATREPIFTDLNFSIVPGETTALVGPTGSGKTTLMRLLLRFHDPSTGEITLDGKPLTSLKRKQLRAKISLVSQRITLFTGTVKENIAYGKQDASDDEIDIAAKAAEANEFISTLPNGIDTKIGEGGHRLSGGQRQRISIARAILKDAPILILDEATSSVDNETEAAIQRSLVRISTGRTVIVIAHRLSTIRNANRIVVLDKGEIVEDGTHAKLLANNGLYATLWSVQTGQQNS